MKIGGSGDRIQTRHFLWRIIIGKRSTFKRRKNDFYETPEEAVLPLLPHLKPNTKFIEPCAGNGALIKILEGYRHTCVRAYDINSTHYEEKINKEISFADAENSDYIFGGFDCFITNPPWTRSILHPIIANLSKQKPTWLLFDAGWIYTKQAKPYLKYLHKTVVVGRLKWIKDSKYYSKDDAVWYLFNQKRFNTGDINLIKNIEFTGKQ